MVLQLLCGLGSILCSLQVVFSSFVLERVEISNLKRHTACFVGGYRLRPTLEFMAETAMQREGPEATWLLLPLTHQKQEGSVKGSGRVFAGM